MSPRDELEVITPKDFYVFGCNPKGKMVIGLTPTNPELMKTMAITGERVYIPKMAMSALGFTQENAIRVYYLEIACY